MSTYATRPNTEGVGLWSNEKTRYSLIAVLAMLICICGFCGYLGHRRNAQRRSRNVRVARPSLTEIEDCPRLWDAWVLPEAGVAHLDEKGMPVFVSIPFVDPTAHVNDYRDGAMGVFVAMPVAASERLMLQKLGNEEDIYHRLGHPIFLGTSYVRYEYDPTQWA